MYHEGNRQLQDRHGTRALADRLRDRSRDHFNAGDYDFIAARDMFFLATADAEGKPSCSYKGGDPGFVRVVESDKLQWHDYDGNGMFKSLGNTLVNEWVGLLFIDFLAQERLRVEGRASISGDVGDLTVTVAVERIYPNCPRYIHQLKLVERSKYVPRDEAPPPEPAWKSADWARDVLPPTATTT